MEASGVEGSFMRDNVTGLYVHVYNLPRYRSLGIVTEHVLRKIHHCAFGKKISQRPFLSFYPKIFHFSHRALFNVFYCYAPSPPCYTHPHAVFHVSTPCFVLL